MPDYNKVSFPQMEPLDINLLLPQADPITKEFISKILVLDPVERYTALQAKNDLYFIKNRNDCELSDIIITSKNKNDKSISKQNHY